MKKKIMIIDDDKSAVKFLSVILDENGYETLFAYDGKEGLEKLMGNDVDLVVLDVMMPKKSGFVLFNQLKKIEKLKDIPILMLTGVAASLQNMDAESYDTDTIPFDSLRVSLRKQIKKMREEGDVRPDIFVDKPVDPDTFVNKVHQLIDT